MRNAQKKWAAEAAREGGGDRLWGVYGDRARRVYEFWSLLGLVATSWRAARPGGSCRGTRSAFPLAAKP